MATTVLIAYEITNNGIKIIGEYTFAPAGATHEFTYPKNQAVAAAATHLETELGLRTEQVVLFSSQSAEHNADRLAAARAKLIEHFAGV